MGSKSILSPAWPFHTRERTPARMVASTTNLVTSAGVPGTMDPKPMKTGGGPAARNLLTAAAYSLSSWNDLSCTLESTVQYPVMCMLRVGQSSSMGDRDALQPHMLGSLAS